MEPHFAGDRLWTPEQAGATCWWQVYIVVPKRYQQPGTALYNLLHKSLRVVEQWGDAFSWIDDLHITVQPIGSGPRELTAMDQERLLIGLSQAVADLEPFEIQVGSVFASGSGVLADCGPDDQLNDLVDRVRGAITETLGAAASAGYDSRPLHLGLAYGMQHLDSGPVTSTLRRRVRPSHAPMKVTHLTLVQMYQDVERGQYRIVGARDPIRLGPFRSMKESMAGF